MSTAVKQTNITTIEKSVVRGTQSVIYTHIYKTDTGFKLKVRIERDSYDKQSSATISVWDAASLKWNFVHGIHYSEMASLKTVNIYATVPATVAQFQTDAANLKLKAKLILL